MPRDGFLQIVVCGSWIQMLHGVPPAKLEGWDGWFVTILDVHRAGMKAIDHCYAIKFLKSHDYFEGLSHAMRLLIARCLWETSCLEVVNLFNNQSIDFTKMTFIVDEIKTLVSNYREVSFLYSYKVEMSWLILWLIKL